MTISIGASLAYFILSFFTLFLLYIQYEVVNYCNKDALLWWRFFILLYGIIILTLGIAELCVDLIQVTDKSASIWLTLSNN